MAAQAKNTICLWYNGDAEDAARFYAKTFPDSAVKAVHRAPADFPSGKKGDVLIVEFTVLGIPCIGLNGGPTFPQTEAFSFQVATDDQAETDRYWNAIVGTCRPRRSANDRDDALALEGVVGVTGPEREPGLILWSGYLQISCSPAAGGLCRLACADLRCGRLWRGAWSILRVRSRVGHSSSRKAGTRSRQRCRWSSCAGREGLTDAPMRSVRA